MHQAPTEPVAVGTPVWFLQTGQATDKPLPAQVIEMSETNMVARISFIDRDGGLNYRLCCHPLGSPALVDDKGKPNVNAVRNGAWTYNPMFMPKQKTVKAK